MDRISDLPDDLLVKILSFAPTKQVVSTSILSKRWESRWLWVPKFEFISYLYNSSEDLPLRDFITKYLSLLKPPVLESFRLRMYSSPFKVEDIRQWVETMVSRCIRELDICICWNKFSPQRGVVLPSSLYTCKSLVTLKLGRYNIIVDVPRMGDLPCLKNLELNHVTYSNEESLQLLLSYCPVLEDLVIDRYGSSDNLKNIVICVPSLLKLSLPIVVETSHEGYEIVTPSLKYFTVTDVYCKCFSYVNMHMPKVEEADLFVKENVERLFESISSVKRLSLLVSCINKDKSMYRNDIVFNKLEHLKIEIKRGYWSKFLIQLLEYSPKLQVLKILVNYHAEFEEYESASWINDQSSVPKCLVESLVTFEFAGYTGSQAERGFVSYILKNARRLKSSSTRTILRLVNRKL